jgi:hypothetical protein
MTENFTSIYEVDRIAAIDDPAVRNLQITQSYYEISSAMAKRMGGCATWCTFATWASKQAGRTIRREDLGRALEKYLKAKPEITKAIADIATSALLKNDRLNKSGIAKMVWETVDPNAAMYRASEAVARGNQKVYAEIAREFARFIDICMHDEAYDAAHIDAFCAPLKPGDPPDGQRYLRQAFSRYYHALFEPDAKARAEHILTANLEIGFHEQTRLQPEIKEALEASVESPQVFKWRLLNLLFPGRAWIHYIGSIFSIITGRPTLLDKAINRFSEAARGRIRKFLTRRLMEIGLPKGLWLQLGYDLPISFPPILEKLIDVELIGLLQQIDPTPDSVKDTGAVDWADFSERIHFIADLFRCYQETPKLLDPPFAPEQTKEIKAGRVPSGNL